MLPKLSKVWKKETRRVLPLSRFKMDSLLAIYCSSSEGAQEMDHGPWYANAITCVTAMLHMWIPIKAQCNTLLCKPWTYVLPAGPLKRIQGCSGTESKPADVPNWIYQLTLGHSEETDWRKCKRASVGASRWQITSTPIWHTGRPWGSSSWTSAFTEEDDGIRELL